MTLLGPGALSTALPASALAEPALGHTHIPHHLPWLLAELTLFRRAICLQACPSAPATSVLWSRTSRRSSAARWRSVEAPSPLPPLGTTGGALQAQRVAARRRPVGRRRAGGGPWSCLGQPRRWGRVWVAVVVAQARMTAHICIHAIFGKFRTLAPCHVRCRSRSAYQSVRLCSVADLGRVQCKRPGMATFFSPP